MIRRNIIAASALALVLAFSASCVGEGEREVPVTSVRVEPSSCTLTEGGSYALDAVVLPEDATDRTVRWSTSDERVATVTAEGVVTGVSAGTAVLTAVSGACSATCSVVVEAAAAPEPDPEPEPEPDPEPEPEPQPVAVDTVILDRTYVQVTEGDSFSLVATVLPDDAADKSVIWSTSDGSVVTVEDGKAAAVAEGTAVITARAGGKSAACEVKVDKKIIPVESVSLDRTSVEMDIDETLTLSATVFPENADDKTVSWESSDPAVASVSDGTVVALKSGTAVITASAGGKCATCTVTVKKPGNEGFGGNDPIDF